VDEHRGEILEKVVRKRNPNITDLSKKVGYDRQTIYRHFKDTQLSDSIILKYAKALKYDFYREFPDLLNYSNMVAEPLADYRPLTLSDALKEADGWKNKYISLLERYNELLLSIKTDS
jgi:AcrR family transcriptional regulator